MRWESHGRKRGGVASTYLADRRRVGDTVRSLRQAEPPLPPARGRQPPDHHDRRRHRRRALPRLHRGAREDGAKGKSWLFFGERNFTNDFLYQLEWQEHLAAGALSRIDVAFSRDQPEKIYVQQRLWEHRAELLKWIEDGAHIYVCGDEKGMARDVDVMLARILARGRAAATRKPGAPS